MSPWSEYLIMPGQSDLNLLDTMVRRGSNIAASLARRVKCRPSVSFLRHWGDIGYPILQYRGYSEYP